MSSCPWTASRPWDAAPAARRFFALRASEPRLGIKDLSLKYDAACHPTLSFKDRLVAVALSKAREFGMDTVGCASTGNLGNAVAAGAAAAGLRAVVLVPEDLEAAKLTGTAVFGATLVGVRGNYDRVNRLCAQIADRHGWGFVNVNLRTYYGEGSKTVGFELAEQGGWRLPGHVVSPMAGGSLIGKVERAFRQLVELAGRGHAVLGPRRPGRRLQPHRRPRGRRGSTRWPR